MSTASLASYFDHTILKPAATTADVELICKEAIEYSFFSVCINPCRVSLAAKLLADSPAKTCSVIGFPLGSNTTSLKAEETRQAISDGADEIDMVINIGALKENNRAFVEQDIRAVVDAAQGRVVKVILETCLLEESEIVTACKLSQNAGAHFVKTSTGFGGGGATVSDVELMKKTVGKKLKVKASGGIKTLADARALIAAGADRIGASAGVDIIKEVLDSGE